MGAGPLPHLQAGRSPRHLALGLRGLRRRSGKGQGVCALLLGSVSAASSPEPGWLDSGAGLMLAVGLATGGWTHSSGFCAVLIVLGTCLVLLCVDNQDTDLTASLPCSL